MSYFTLRTIIVLMETMKDFYSSTTIPPSAAVATRRCDLRVNGYTRRGNRPDLAANHEKLARAIRDRSGGGLAAVATATVGTCGQSTAAGLLTSRMTAQ